MKLITQEWVDKAGGDFATAQRELQVEINANYDAVCFHAQQCAEKYLKAYLQELDIYFDKTHELTVLLDSLIDIVPEWETMRTALTTLTRYAIQYRYPGESATREEAKQAFSDCSRVRKVVTERLS